MLEAALVPAKMPRSQFTNNMSLLFHDLKAGLEVIVCNTVNGILHEKYADGFSCVQFLYG